MSLLEALTGVFIASLLVAMVVGFTSTSTRLAAKFDTQANNFRKAREAMEWMSRDIQSADAVLSEYGGEACDGSTTLILRLPQVDGSGNIVSGPKRIVMYQFENNALSRYTGLDGSALTLDRVVVPKLKDLRLDYYAVEAFMGDGAKSTFTISAPLDSASTREPSVLVSGDDLFQASQASFAGTTLTLVGPPDTGEQVDVTFATVPGQEVDPDGKNGAGMVEVTLMPDKNWKGATQQDMESLSEINNRVLLRNRD
jgi:hypothetical protein